MVVVLALGGIVSFLSFALGGIAAVLLLCMAWESRRYELCEGECLFYVRLSMCFVIIAVMGFFSCGDIESLTFDEKEPTVDVLETRQLRAFDENDDDGIHIDRRKTNLAVYVSESIDVGESEKSGSYTVMEDELGDGGIKEASYPKDETRMYEDATAETARVEEVDEVWLESVRGGFEPYRVCGFAVPPSLRRTGVRLPFVEMYNAEEGREAVLLNPNNFIRSATVRVTR